MNRWDTAIPLRRGRSWIQDDEAAVLNPDTGSLHMLNAPALAIWELCDGETTPAEMADAITDLTGLDRSAAWTDVTRTLDQLTEAGLVEPGHLEADWNG